MKLNIIRNICLSALMVLFLFSCGGNSTGGGDSYSSTPVTSAAKASAQSASFLYISDINNVQLAELILESGGNNKINTKNGTFFGEKKGDKLKYYDQQDNFRYEVKYKESSFKLRDRNSALLWKVKTYDNKIKLSNNEEMENPIEIKLKNDQKIVVYKNGAEDQTIRIDLSKSPLNISNQYYSNGSFKNIYHAAILNLSELNTDEKYMLIAELNR